MDTKTKIYKHIIAILIFVSMGGGILYNYLLQTAATNLELAPQVYQGSFVGLPSRTGSTSAGHNGILLWGMFVLIGVGGIALNRSLGVSFSKPFSLAKENLHKTPEQLGIKFGIVTGTNAFAASAIFATIGILVIISANYLPSFLTGLDIISKGLI